MPFDLTPVADVGPNRKQKFVERLLPQIEAALTKGLSHKVIHATLLAAGLNLTWGQYENALFRARQKKRRVAAVGMGEPSPHLLANRSSFPAALTGASRQDPETISRHRPVSLPGLEPVPNSLGFDPLNESTDDFWHGTGTGAKRDTTSKSSK